MKDEKWHGFDIAKFEAVVFSSLFTHFVYKWPFNPHDSVWTTSAFLSLFLSFVFPFTYSLLVSSICLSTTLPLQLSLPRTVLARLRIVGLSAISVASVSRFPVVSQWVNEFCDRRP